MKNQFVLLTDFYNYKKGQKFCLNKKSDNFVESYSIGNNSDKSVCFTDPYGINIQVNFSVNDSLENYFSNKEIQHNIFAIKEDFSIYKKNDIFVLTDDKNTVQEFYNIGNGKFFNFIDPYGCNVIFRLNENISSLFEPLIFEKKQIVKQKIEKILGPIGPQGIQGPKGDIGPAGPQGPKGDDGQIGLQGNIGPIGPEGPQGIQGPKGDVGPAGPQGPKGNDGQIGPKGDIGPQGIQGPKGDVGPMGPAGPQGPQGNIGPQGKKGLDGIKGDVGPVGPQGPKGDVGPQGNIGPMGPEGPQGIQGPKGDIGPQGIQGPKGDVGPMGPAGPQGIQGPKGDVGPVGPQGQDNLLNVSYPLKYDKNTKHLQIDLSKLNTSKTNYIAGGGLDTAFKQVNVDGTLFESVQYEKETLNFISGDNITLVADAENKSITISSSGSGSSSASSSSTISITQNSHGFTSGEALYFNGYIWQRAIANSANTLGIGLSKYTDTNRFDLIFSGQINNLSGLIPGNYYFVSSLTAGQITTEESNISNPILFAVGTTFGIVLPYRPSINNIDNTNIVQQITSGNFNITTETLLIVNNSITGATCGVYLPESSSNRGKQTTVKDISSSITLTIYPYGSDKIDGLSTYDGSNKITKLITDGSNWYTV